MCVKTRAAFTRRRPPKFVQRLRFLLLPLYYYIHSAPRVQRKNITYRASAESREAEVQSPFGDLINKILLYV